MNIFSRLYKDKKFEKHFNHAVVHYMVSLNSEGYFLLEHRKEHAFGKDSWFLYKNKERKQVYGFSSLPNLNTNHNGVLASQLHKNFSNLKQKYLWFGEVGLSIHSERELSSENNSLEQSYVHDIWQFDDELKGDETKKRFSEDHADIVGDYKLHFRYCFTISNNKILIEHREKNNWRYWFLVKGQRCFLICYYKDDLDAKKILDAFNTKSFDGFIHKFLFYGHTSLKPKDFAKYIRSDLSKIFYKSSFIASERVKRIIKLE